MKQTALFAAFLLISIASSGMKKFALPKDDFLKQVSSGSIPKASVYCYREDGHKVWFAYTKATVLAIQLTNGKEKWVMVRGLQYKDGIIAAPDYNVWLPTKKIDSVNINDVASFYIIRRFQEVVTNYVDIDSSRSLIKLKNDSLAAIYAQRNELMITWTTRSQEKGDTFYIREKACYNLVFRDESQTEFGVVQKITKDSIYISNTYNQEWATFNKRTYKILGYAIQDITQLRLLKSGGYGYKTLKSGEYDLITGSAPNNILRFPCWYGGSPTTGALELYQAWLTADGFKGIREEGGKIYWYESSL